MNGSNRTVRKKGFQAPAGNDYEAEHERMVMAQQSAHIGVWDWDMTTGALTWSDEFYAIFGLPLQTPATFETFNRVLHPDDREAANARIQEAIDLHIRLHNEYRIILPDGRERWIEAFGSAYYDESGKPFRMIGYCSDISERKEAEVILRESETKHKTMIANISDVIAIMTGDGTLSYKSPNIEKWFGWQPDDLIGTDGWDTVHPDDLKRIQREFLMLLEQDRAKRTVEYRYKCKDGNYKLIELTAINLTHDPMINGVLMNYHDITERKLAEEEITLATQKTIGILESITDAFFALDENMVTTYFNNAAERLLNRNRIDVIGRYLFEAFPEAKGSIFEEKYTRAIREKKMLTFESYFGEKPYENWYEVRVYPQRDGISIFFQVVTERKLAEQALQTAIKALKKSESNLAEAQSIAHIGSWEWDLQSNKLVWSEEMYRIFGLTPDTFDNKPETLANIIHPDDRESYLKTMREDFLSGTQKPLEYRVIHPDGSIHNIFGHGMVIRNEEGNPIRNLGVVQDITERKNLEKSLVESEKLAGIGTLAAGIAHEINTPLQIITGASENLQKKLSSGVVVHPDELNRRLQNINENAWRISAIVRSLLDYARSAPGDIQACSINHIVQNMLTLTEHQFKSWSNIHILTWLDENLPDVKCNPNKIIQVLVNLLNNARDAMPKGGRIHIETTFDPELSMVLLRVKDSGVGIPADHSSRIFDPFFTTKQPGEGTGLGLSISAGILRAHGGKIELENTRESGSCFKLSLPIAGPENGASAKLESAGRYR